MELARNLDIEYRNLNSALKGKRNSCGGWHFTYDLDANYKTITNGMSQAKINAIICKVKEPQSKHHLS